MIKKIPTSLQGRLPSSVVFSHLNPPDAENTFHSHKAARSVSAYSPTEPETDRIKLSAGFKALFCSGGEQNSPTHTHMQACENIYNSCRKMCV